MIADEGRLPHPVQKVTRQSLERTDFDARNGFNPNDLVSIRDPFRQLLNKLRVDGIPMSTVRSVPLPILLVQSTNSEMLNLHVERVIFAPREVMQLEDARAYVGERANGRALRRVEVE